MSGIAGITEQLLSHGATSTHPDSLPRHSTASSRQTSLQRRSSSSISQPSNHQDSHSHRGSPAHPEPPSEHSFIAQPLLNAKRFDLPEQIPRFFGQIVTPSDPDYSMAIARWAYNAQRYARLVTYPRFVTDVFAVISYAYENGIPLTVRGGGHSCAGTSSCAGGLVIDLSRHFAGVRIDTLNQIAFVGGGAVWRDVDEAAIQYGLAAVGGTVNHTGVGGLTLGGGYGWLTGQHGLACDNVIAATIVTPGAADSNGALHPTSRTVSAVSEPDLFFAIRGGGGNFGVVTEFAIRLHPQRRMVWSGTITYPPEALEDVFTVLEEWWKEASSGRRPKESSLVFFYIDPTLREPRIAVRPFFNGSEIEGRERFAFLFSIGHIVDQTRELPYELVNAQQNEQAQPGHNMYMTGTSRNDFSLVTARALFDTFSRIAAAPYSGSAVIVEYLPLHVVRARSSHWSAFPGRNKGDNIVVLIHWPQGDDSGSLEAAREYARQLKEVIWDHERAVGIAVDSDGYANYQTDIADDSAASRLFGELYPRLQEIKLVHDPHGLFNKFYPIKPPN